MSTHPMGVPGAVGSSVTDNPSISRMIIGLDLDEHGRRAIEWARTTASALGVPLVAWLGVDNASTERSPSDEAAFEKAATDSAREWLTRYQIDVDDIHVSPRRPDATLAESATVGDLVVLGVDTSEGWSGWALGSRAHGLAHTLKCPLVLVPPSPIAADDAPIVVGDDGTQSSPGVLQWGSYFADKLHRSLVVASGSDPLNDAADVFNDLAISTGAYLTVVGARAEHSFGGLLLGPVVDHLIHHAPRAIAILTHATLSSDEAPPALGQQS
ncbi:MAG TPA: universal stress protein [Ilumatobacteraceae bacterium]|nr:universal stress protein [Ilumatobacteraceae bacterium]